MAPSRTHHHGTYLDDEDEEHELSTLRGADTGLSSRSRHPGSNHHHKDVGTETLSNTHDGGAASGIVQWPLASSGARSPPTGFRNDDGISARNSTPETQRGAVAGGSTNKRDAFRPVKQSLSRRASVEAEQGLNELVAPQPIEDDDDSGRWRKQDNLESAETPRGKTSRPPKRQPSRDVSEEEEGGLNELVAPQPIKEEDASGKWRKEDKFENAESEVAEEIKHEERHTRKSEFATQTYIMAELVFFSFLGTLARLGTQWLTFYPGAPVVFSNLWANFGGTLVMGFLQEDRKLFAEEWGRRKPTWQEQYSSGHTEKGKGRSPEASDAHAKVKKTMPLYIGLTVGFCGSFTSFSSFQRDVFYGFSNTLPSPLHHPTTASTVSPTTTVPRNNGYSISAVLAIWILTVSVCYGALLAGASAAKALDRFTPTLPYSFLRRVWEPLIVFLALGCWLGAVFLAIFPPDRSGGPASRGTSSHEAGRGEVLFALVFSPLGCLARFWLSIKLNSLLPWFPLGTFSANMFGTAILSACLDLQHVPLAPVGAAVGGGLVGCQVLQGIEDGFCGCLTTVSTWIVEIKGLRSRHAWFYAGSSVTGGLAFTVVIMGSVLWSIGWSPIACVVSNA